MHRINKWFKKLYKLDKSNQTKKLETIYTQKIAYLEEMKKSVLQKAFSGKLAIDNEILTA